ncbi:uncharacterized protein SCODWIG_02379 [Saccharomycodes ludwigii]|uniref:VASt domain-containing protein n=1 Tax=Saccharomycodes ludwigii TaxID=36035 RepID=A0A376B7H2_9ASCO|nr:uncharacterized protein SCODWIG_02379 [Saccharomycodes ludwigii]
MMEDMIEDIVNQKPASDLNNKDTGNSQNFKSQAADPLITKENVSSNSNQNAPIIHRRVKSTNTNFITGTPDKNGNIKERKASTSSNSITETTSNINKTPPSSSIFNSMLASMSSAFTNNTGLQEENLPEDTSKQNYNSANGTTAINASTNNNSMISYRKQEAAINNSNDTSDVALVNTHTGSNNNSNNADNIDVSFDSTNSNNNMLYSTTDYYVKNEIPFAHESRNELFHNSFKSVPSQDRLIDIFSCSLSKDSIFQGKMYVSEKYICFNSKNNLLGLWATNIVICLDDIASINNNGEFTERPSIIAPNISSKFKNNNYSSHGTGSVTSDNNIVINTLYGRSFNFSGFSDKNKASKIIKTIWENSLKKSTLVTSSMQKGVDSDDKTKYGNGKDDKDGILQDTKDRSASNVSEISADDYRPNSIGGLYKHGIHNNQSGILIDAFQYDIKLSEKHKRANSNILENINAKNLIPADLEDAILSVDESVYEEYHEKEKPVTNNYSDEYEDDEDDDYDSEEESKITDNKLKQVKVYTFIPKANYTYKGQLYHDETEFIYSPEEDNKEDLLAEVELNAPPGIIFELLFSENNPSFTLSYLSGLNSSNFQPPNLGAFNKINQDGQKYREYQYDKGLNYPVGPKTTRCLVRETILSLEYDNYINVLNTTRTPDVPSGSNFSVKTRYMIRWGPNGSSVLKISFWVDWTGSSWIKSMIDKSCKSGQKEATKVLLVSLQEKLEQVTEMKKLSLDEAISSEMPSSNNGILSKSPSVTSLRSLPQEEYNYKGNTSGAAGISTGLNKTGNLYSNKVSANGFTNTNIHNTDLKLSFFSFTNILLFFITFLLLLNLYFQFKIMSKYNLLNDIIPQFLSSQSNEKSSVVIDETTEKLLENIDALVQRRMNVKN